MTKEKKKVQSVKRDDKIDEVKSSDKPKKAKEQPVNPVPNGVGGQFVELGGGVRVPASEIGK